MNRVRWVCFLCPLSAKEQLCRIRNDAALLQKVIALKKKKGVKSKIVFWLLCIKLE